MYELTIIGGGPAGVAAGIYAARKKIKTIFITNNFGGQSVVSAEIRNWIGEIQISGFDLAQKLENHLKSYKDIEIVENDFVSEIKKGEKYSEKNTIFEVITKKGLRVETKNILLASGSLRRRLEVPGEKEYEGRGVAYCAICDAPLFSGKDVVVVGGGNSALESALDLLPYANRIYMLVRGDVLKGDQLTQEKVKMSDKIEIIFNAETKEIIGDGKGVKSVLYFDKKSNEVKEIKAEGVFVEIGNIPNSSLVKDLVALNSFGEIIIDHKTQKTSLPGIWAAGDVTDVLYKQNNISAGDAIKAALNIYDAILGKERKY